MHKPKTLLLIFIAVLSVFYASRAVLVAFWPSTPQAQTTSVVDVEQRTPTATVAEPSVQKYESVESYFVAGNPNPVSHLAGHPKFKRDVSSSKRKRLIERDGGCCVICGSTKSLELDHRRALMNLGNNDDDNLATLCHECHVKNTRLDRSLNKKREKR